MSDRPQLVSVKDGSLEELRKKLEQLQPEPTVLLGIGLWGWTGDGKTTAFLTGIHYCDPTVHGISLARIRDTDELAALSVREEYAHLDLEPLARASSERLEQLLTEFIDRAAWPPGTDEGNAYLVRIDNLSKTLAFAVVTDLPGGNYLEYDPTASAVLENMGACLVMVDPERYSGTDTISKDYRDEVAHRIKKCAEHNIPTAVLLAKCDRYAADSASVADRTQGMLELIIGRHPEVPIRIFRSSVVQDIAWEPGEGNPLPGGDERQPDLLVGAWVWLITQALSRETSSLLERVPVTAIRQVAASREVVGRAPIAELRRVAEFSQCPGSVMCAASDCDGAFIALDDEDGLHRAVANGKERPHFLSLGSLKPRAAENVPAGEVAASAGSEEDENVLDYQSIEIAGNLVFGDRWAPAEVWSGPVADAIAPYPLPSDVMSWFPVGPRSLVAIDQSGRLQLLKQGDGRWVQSDYFTDFLPASNAPLCGYVARERLVVGVGALKAAGVRLDASGKFGDRIDVPLPQLEAENGCISPIGVVGALDAETNLILAYSDSASDAAPAITSVTLPFALGNRNPVAALVSAKLRLHLAIHRGGEWNVTSVDLSPLLPRSPTGLCWSRDDRLVVASYEDGSWDLFELHGAGLT